MIRLIMRPIALLALAGSFAACSSQPTTPPIPPAPDAAASVPAPSADSAARAAPDNASTGKPQGKIPSGYRRVKRGGTDYYCRSVVTIGSRLAEQVCFTREQLEEIVRRTDSTLNDMERGRKVCVGIEGCGFGD